MLHNLLETFMKEVSNENNKQMIRDAIYNEIYIYIYMILLAYLFLFFMLVYLCYKQIKTNTSIDSWSS
jgi:ABC-type phosphate transport system permease subunit